MEIGRSVINAEVRTLSCKWTVEYAEINEVYISDSILEEIEQQVIAELRKQNKKWQ